MPPATGDPFPSSSSSSTTTVRGVAFASTQNKFVFLSQSLSKNFVHLMRLIPCHENTSAGRALKPWDEQLDGLMQIIAGTRSMDHLNRGLAALPACQGGLGIVTTADLADPCFIAGKLSVARSLTNCGPVDLSLAVTSLLDLSQTLFDTHSTRTIVGRYISHLACSLRSSERVRGEGRSSVLCALLFLDVREILSPSLHVR